MINRAPSSQVCSNNCGVPNLVMANFSLLEPQVETVDAAPRWEPVRLERRFSCGAIVVFLHAVSVGVVMVLVGSCS